MSTTQYASVNNSDTISLWRQQTAAKLALFLNVMKDDGTISDKEIQNALTYLRIRGDELTQADYPAIASDIQEQLLNVLNNMTQSLAYRQADNPYQAQLRLEMAIANMDVLRFRLLEFKVSI